jgi:acetoin utilization deacetylase AcuC-like enzyme
MATVQLLVESGARTNLYSRSYKRPLDVAAGGFDDEKDDDAATTTDRDAAAVDPRERQTTRWNMLRYSSQCRTLVLHHHECLDHMTKSNHDWEVPDRIDSIMSTLASRTFASPPSEEEKDTNYFNACEITVSNEFERATLELLSRIHSADYLAFVNELSKELDRKRKQQLLENVQNSELSGNNGGDASLSQEHHILPFTPMIQKKFIKEAMTKADGHSDTSFSAGSLKAARRAAGAVQHAVDW